jgi:hypothetical protein
MPSKSSKTSASKSSKASAAKTPPSATLKKPRTAKAGTAPVSAAAHPDSASAALPKSKAAGQTKRAKGGARNPAATAQKPVGGSPKVVKAEGRDKDAGTKRKMKLVRDSFTIPKSEYGTIADLKERALSLGRSVRKSEVIRAGLAALKALPQDALARVLAAVPSIKTGRPKKQKQSNITAD